MRPQGSYTLGAFSLCPDLRSVSGVPQLPGVPSELPREEV